MANPTRTGSVEKITPKSNLSSSAQEVAERLRVVYAGLQEIKEEIEGSLIALGNKIIEGEATEADKVNFRLSLTELKSEVIASLKKRGDEKGEVIVNNFIDKLGKSVDEDESKV